MPESVTTGTVKVVALFAAATLLAISGILLLVVDRGHPASRAASPTPAASSTDTTQPQPTPPEPTGSAVPSTQGTAAPDEVPAPASVPPKAAQTARQFVIAWASHDASPGHDTSFSDAGRRSAAYATADLAAQLRDPGDRSTRLWQQWVADKTRDTCVIDRVATPDGAPAPTTTRAFVRVLYTCTTYSAGHQPTRSPDQLALEMHLASAGAWRVGALVNA
ncbi:hypothetical protein ABZ883_37135 [Streptomyces sp. NPDC046977]|uniref:hypothetical protein n=1 Tax=Streptomyces sp. NPDC046977 TaxID=3154703 RepID=UPI0033C7999E